MENEGRHMPVAMAVFASLIVLAFILIGAAGVGISSYLSLHAIHNQEVAAQQLRAKEMTAQLREGVPTCRAIADMDKAAHVPSKDFPKPPSNGYDERLSRAIHEIDVNSKCALILNDVAHHVPYSTILRQINDSTPAHRNAGQQG